MIRAKRKNCLKKSFDNEKNSREISEHKIAAREKTAGLWSGNSWDWIQRP